MGEAGIALEEVLFLLHCKSHLCGQGKDRHVLTVLQCNPHRLKLRGAATESSAGPQAAAEIFTPLSLGTSLAFFHPLAMKTCSAVDPRVLPDLSDTRA